MTNDPNECSEHAKRCVALAARAKDPVVTRRLLEIAQSWMRLALDLSKTDDRLPRSTERKDKLVA
jgi:hypothetical protein